MNGAEHSQPIWPKDLLLMSKSKYDPRGFSVTGERVFLTSLEGPIQYQEGALILWLTGVHLLKQNIYGCISNLGQKYTNCLPPFYSLHGSEWKSGRKTGSTNQEFAFTHWILNGFVLEVTKSSKSSPISFRSHICLDRAHCCLNSSTRLPEGCVMFAQWTLFPLHLPILPSHQHIHLYVWENTYQAWAEEECCAGSLCV